ncbi:MAG: LLM class F420-dependent oxidoreductase [Acidimicrobiales bacterium]
MTIEIGRIGLWTSTFEGHPWQQAADAARQIEALGFPTVWIPEATGRDAFVHSTLLLSATTTLKVATGIANVYARDAMTTAASQKTLAEAFPDRFLLGLGVSSPALVEKVRQHDYGKPYTYMRQYLEAMDKAMFTSVAPASDPGRVLAALGPKMLALSASHAGGAHPYLTPPEHTASAREILGAGALLAPEQMVVLSTDPSAARDIARKAISFYLRAPGYLANLTRLGYGDEDWADWKAPSDRLVDAIVAWGSTDAVCGRIRAHLDAGADHVCIQVLTAGRGFPVSEWTELAGALL